MKNNHTRYRFGAGAIGKRHQPCHRPLTTWAEGDLRIVDVQILLNQGRVLLVVPVSEDDSVFCVILVNLLDVVNDERGTETVNILALRVDLVRSKMKTSGGSF